MGIYNPILVYSLTGIPCTYTLTKPILPPDPLNIVPSLPLVSTVYNSYLYAPKLTAYAAVQVKSLSPQRFLLPALPLVYHGNPLVWRLHDQILQRLLSLGLPLLQILLPPHPPLPLPPPLGLWGWHWREGQRSSLAFSFSSSSSCQSWEASSGTCEGEAGG